MNNLAIDPIPEWDLGSQDDIRDLRYRLDSKSVRVEVRHFASSLNDSVPTAPVDMDICLHDNESSVVDSTDESALEAFLSTGITSPASNNAQPLPYTPESTYIETESFAKDDILGTHRGHQFSRTATLRAKSDQPQDEATLSYPIFSPASNQARIVSHLVDSISSAYPSRFSHAPPFPTYGTWLTLVAFRAGSSQVLDFALRAFSLGFLGSSTQDKELIEKSRLQYGQALLRLNKALQTPQEGFADETLCATMLLALFELLTCTATESWVRHAGGLGRLVQLRGPECHKTGLGKATFYACRNTILLEAFIAGKPCFLDQPQWRKMANEIYQRDIYRGKSRDAIEAFFQETLQFPGYFYDARLVQRHRNPYGMLQTLIERGKMLRSGFKQLFLRVEATLKSDNLACREVPSQSSDPVFPIAYRFVNVTIRALYCGYWTCLTILNRVITDLEIHYLSCLNRITLHDHNLTELKSRHSLYSLESRENAHNICRSAEDVSTNPLFSPTFIFFALGTAISHLHSKEEVDWVTSKMKTINESIGIEQFRSFETLRLQAHLNPP